MTGGSRRPPSYSGFTAHYNAIFPFQPATYTFMAGRLPCAACRVLDIGCGTGQYTGRFAADGHDALGIDLDGIMIDAARAQNPGARFRVMDMTDLDRLNTEFHLVYSTGNVISYVTPDAFQEFLNRLHHRLVPGGIWIFQTVNWVRRLAENDMEFPVVNRPDRGLVFRRRYAPAGPGKIAFSLNLEHDGVCVFNETHILYPRLPATVNAAHAEAGFILREYTGSFAGEPFDPAVSPASIWVFER